jgi:hypothetical protein
LQLKPTVKILGTASTHEELDALEIQLIRDARIRGDRLTNLADGGKSSSGYRLGEEFGRKVSQRMRTLGVPASKRSVATSAILVLRANGKTKKQIASELGLSMAGIAFRLRRAREEALF